MAKLVSLFMTLIVIVQLLRPLGIPGLKRRADAWKIVIAAFVVVGLVASIKPN